MRCPLTDKNDKTKGCAETGSATKRDGARPDLTVLVMTCGVHGEVEMNPAVWAGEAGIAWTAPEPVPVATEDERVLRAAQIAIADAKAAVEAKAFQAKVAAKIAELTK